MQLSEVVWLNNSYFFFFILFERKEKQAMSLEEPEYKYD